MNRNAGDCPRCRGFDFAAVSIDAAPGRRAIAHRCRGCGWPGPAPAALLPKYGRTPFAPHPVTPERKTVNV